MIAEIKNKLNRYNIYNSEDKLTGDFFQIIRYLPIDIGLNILLRLSLKDHFNGISQDKYKYIFWPQDSTYGEIDLILENKSTVIGIEVKYKSGLSSDDEITNEINSENNEKSINQLAKYSELLNEKLCSSKKLIFLAPLSQAVKVFNDVNKREIINKNVEMYWLCWEHIYKEYMEIIVATDNPMHKQMICDLLEYLEYKGFANFSGFDNKIEAVTTNAYKFKVPQINLNYKYNEIRSKWYEYTGVK